MLIDKNLKDLVEKLAEGMPMEVHYHGADISIKFINHHSKLALATSVYDGGNYIPHSIRKCLSQKSPFYDQRFRTFLTVDEPHFQVKLNYLGHTESLDQNELHDLMQEFDLIAEKWRHYLDEHGNKDLIHVPVKR